MCRDLFTDYPANAESMSCVPLRHQFVGAHVCVGWTCSSGSRAAFTFEQPDEPHDAGNGDALQNCEHADKRSLLQLREVPSACDHGVDQHSIGDKPQCHTAALSQQHHTCPDQGSGGRRLGCKVEPKLDGFGADLWNRAGDLGRRATGAV